jgi:hypothetical protein
MYIMKVIEFLLQIYLASVQHSDHASPHTKWLKSSLVEFSPITDVLLGLQRFGRCRGGTQNRNSP